MNNSFKDKVIFDLIVVFSSIDLLHSHTSIIAYSFNIYMELILDNNF